ncbi:putative phage tail protein [Solibacillus sp. FSL W8-0372]|uniref:putative phage tail protein n=1 Tax=Solibacillus sp. FSL W8-0372 TaxID=2921713 RepID=UPI0030D31CF5
MAREVDFLSYLPQIFKEIEEIQAVAHVETPILNGLWQKIEDILNDQFIVTATDSGLSRLEKMLKLNVPATDTIETRRFRLLSRYQEQAPYTNKVLKQLLDSLLGEGKYYYERNVAEKWLKVKLELTVKGQFEAVELMLERIIPQNMILTVELRYNQYSKLAQYTHAQLATFTHQQLREEVI